MTWMVVERKVVVDEIGMVLKTTGSEAVICFPGPSASTAARQERP